MKKVASMEHSDIKQIRDSGKAESFLRNGNYDESDQKLAFYISNQLRL